MIKNKKIFFVLLLITYHLSLVTFVNAEVLDRVVAVVDDDVIMLSEFNEVYQKALNSGSEISREEVLNGLINRVLLLRQAKKFIFDIRIRRNNNVLINDYIEKRLKAFIRIPFDKIELFYEENREFFSPQDESAGIEVQDFYDVRDEIEAFLKEEELNKRLIKHIKELREKAYIRIQLQR